MRYLRGPVGKAATEISGIGRKAMEMWPILGKHVSYMSNLYANIMFSQITLGSLENSGIGVKRVASHPSPSDEVFDCRPRDKNSPAMTISFELAAPDAIAHRLGAHAQQLRGFGNGYIGVRRETLVGSVGALGSSCCALGMVFSRGPRRSTSPSGAVGFLVGIAVALIGCCGVSLCTVGCGMPRRIAASRGASQDADQAQEEGCCIRASW